MAPKRKKKINHNSIEDLFSSSESKPKSESNQNITKTNKTYNKKITTKKAKHNSKMSDIQQLFLSTSKALTVLLDNAIEGKANSKLVIDVFTETFCNDHVKCVLVFPTKLETMSISTTTGDDVEFQYFVRTTPVHSWMKWVTVK